MEEQESIQTLIDNCNRNIDLGRTLSRLRNTPEFKELIQAIYIEDAKKYLWQNIVAYEEAELLEKGSTRTDNIQRMKTEVQARLIFERFLKTVQEDAEDAEETLKQLKEDETNGK